MVVVTALIRVAFMIDVGLLYSSVFLVGLVVVSLLVVGLIIIGGGYCKVVGVVVVTAFLRDAFIIALGGL
jgi:hypothetical protein